MLFRAVWGAGKRQEDEKEEAPTTSFKDWVLVKLQVCAWICFGSSGECDSARGSRASQRQSHENDATVLRHFFLLLKLRSRGQSSFPFHLRHFPTLTNASHLLYPDPQRRLGPRLPTQLCGPAALPHLLRRPRGARATLVRSPPSAFSFLSSPGTPLARRCRDCEAAEGPIAASIPDKHSSIVYVGDRETCVFIPLPPLFSPRCAMVAETVGVIAAGIRKTTRGVRRRGTSSGYRRSSNSRPGRKR